MSKPILTISIILATVALNAQQQPVSLEDSFNAAVEHTEQIPIAQSVLHQAEAQLTEARANFYPRLAAGVSFQKQSAPNSLSGESDYGFARFSVTQSLYAGGRDQAKTKGANETHRAEQFNLSYARNRLYGQVAKIYYGVLSMAQEVANTKTSIEVLEKRIVEIQKRKTIGRSRNIEILALQSQRAILDAQLLAAMASERNARNDLYNVTGLDRNTVLLDDINLPKQQKEIQGLLELIEERPDVQFVKSSLLSRQHSLTATRAEFYPSLDFTANYYPYWYHGSTNAPEWDAAITLSFPLFSGGSTLAKVRLALEDQVQSELLLKQRRRSAEVEINAAINNLQSALEQVKTLEKAVATTKQNYREQEKDYRFSLATNLDVLQALNAHHEAMKTLAKTRYQALSTAAELKALLNDLKQ